jgi:hypothetical protein
MTFSGDAKVAVSQEWSLASSPSAEATAAVVQSMASPVEHPAAFSGGDTHDVSGNMHFQVAYLPVNMPARSPMIDDGPDDRFADFALVAVAIRSKCVVSSSS